MLINYHERKERTTLLIIVPSAIFILAALAVFLIVTEKERNRPPEVLTADQVPAFDSEPPPIEVLIKQSLKEARSLRVVGQHDQAREVLRQLILEAGAPEQAVLLLAQIEKDEGRWDEAIQVLDADIARTPRASVLFARGLAYQLNGESIPAHECFHQAASLNPGRPLLENAAALSSFSIGQADELKQQIALKREFKLAALADTWIMAEAAIYAEEGNFLLAAVTLHNAQARLRPLPFKILLDFPALKKFSQHPELLPFYQEDSQSVFSFRPDEPEANLEP